MDEFFQDILDKGGEGLILRDPNSLYQNGRSSGYLKYKVSILVTTLFLYLIFPSQRFRDAEAQIVKKIAPQFWECILYVFYLFFLFSTTTNM